MNKARITQLLVSQADKVSEMIQHDPGSLAELKQIYLDRECYELLAEIKKIEEMYE